MIDSVLHPIANDASLFICLREGAPIRVDGNLLAFSNKTLGFRANGAGRRGAHPAIGGKQKVPPMMMYLLYCNSI
jgi:hypothetical protein